MEYGALLLNIGDVFGNHYRVLLLKIGDVQLDLSKNLLVYVSYLGTRLYIL